jgi:SAM-dependent methyltransferase
MKANNVKKVLELGAGLGRDSIFFASNGIEVEALDYSAIAIEILDKITKEKRLSIKPQFFDVRMPLPFPDGHFDAAYSHMLFNMRFSLEDRFIFSEINRVLKRNEFNFFSVRDQNDKSYASGIEIEKGFFTEKEIHDLAEGFEIPGMREGYEETVGLMQQKNVSHIFLAPKRGPSNLPPFETLLFALSCNI